MSGVISLLAFVTVMVPYQKHVLLAGGWLACCVTLGLVGSYLFANALVRPLSRLSRATRELSNGNLDARVEAPTLLETRTGEEVPVELSCAPILDDRRHALGIVVVFKDLTERVAAETRRRALQNQANEARRLESLIRMAGGIAHDFNNLLTVIIGNADIAMHAVSPESNTHEHVQSLLAAGKKAAEFCQKMLAFSGKVGRIIEMTDLSELIKPMTPSSKNWRPSMSS